MEPAALPKAKASEFESMLAQLESDQEFREAPDHLKARTIAALRDDYKATREVDELHDHIIDEISGARSDYNKSSRYRVDPETYAKTNIEYPEIDALPQAQALESINKFRKQSEEAAVDFDPLLREDYLFDLHREANELERRVRGKETSWAGDKGYRFAQGAVTGLMRATGNEKLDSLASEFETRFLPENPEMDETFMSELAAAGGDFATTIGLVVAATVVGGPGAGMSVGLATNAARKYRDGYNTEFAKSGDAATAFDAGLASMPGAAVETIGDYLIGGRLAKGVMSSQWRKAYMEAPTGSARASMVTEALKDSNVRNKVIKSFGSGFMVEGSTETAGDITSGLGAFAVTGDDTNIPTLERSAKTFVISGLLGGPVSAVGTALQKPDPIFNNKDHVAKLQEFVKNNDEAGLTDYFQSQMVTPLPEPEIAKPIAEKATVVTKDDGTTEHAIKNAEGKDVTVDEPTAKIHDHLIDSLTKRSTVDTLNELEEGNGKGKRNEPNTNKKRFAAKEAALTLDDEINALLPRRAEQFAEIDATAAAAKIDPKQVDLFKRTVDAAAITAIQNGIDPSIAYKPVFQSGAKPAEAQLNIKLDDKTTLDRQEEVSNLILSQAPEKIEAAKRTNPIEYFAPEAIKAAQGGVKARYAMVDMPIDDYLSLAAPIKPTDSKISEVRKDGDAKRLAVFDDDFTTSEKNVEALRQLAEEGTLFDSIPSLSLEDKTGSSKVVGHEGRHRAMALKALGHTTIPVQVNSNRIRWGMQSDPNSFDFIDESEWPTTLENEDGSKSIPYPIGRDGKYTAGNSILSQSSQNQIRVTKAEREFFESLNEADISYMLDIDGAPSPFIINGDNMLIDQSAIPAISKYIDGIAGERSMDRGKIPPSFHSGEFNKRLEVNSILSQSQQSPESARHAELESKFNNGTITPEETAEAKKISEDRARKAGYTESGARSGFYKGGVPLLPSQSGNLGAGYYAVLGGTLGDVSSYGSTPVYWNADFDSRRTEEVFINLGDKPLFVNHPTDIAEWVKDNGLMPSFKAWVDLQETVNSAYNKIGADRPDNIETRRAGTLWRETVEAKAERRNALLAAGYRDIDIEALGLNQESIETPDTGKMESFLFDRGHVTSIVADWDKAAASGRASGDGRLGKEVSVANPNQIKSAEPFTGVPLDERFNLDSNSILNQSQQNQGTIQFQNEDGTLAPLEVSIDQLNDKLTAVINIMESGGNISTFHHEMMHWYHRSGLMASLLSPEQQAAFQTAANVNNNIWKEENYETVARAYEAWLRNPAKRFDKHVEVPRILDIAFKKIASAFQNIYRSLKNSPLPSTLSAKGITQPSIHPDFRAAFESLYGFNQDLRLNIKSPTDPTTQSPQNASQLPPVTSQLQQDPSKVSSPQKAPQVTEPQLTKEEQAERDDENAANELNIKLLKSFKPETTLDQVAKNSFKSILEFKSILDPQSELGGLFYSILENFMRARKLSKRQGTPPEIRRPVGTKRYSQANFNVVKNPDEQGYTDAINNILNRVEKEAFELWYNDYASRHPELENSNFSDFGSKIEVTEFVKNNKEQKAAADPEQNINRETIDDNMIELQVALRGRLPYDETTKKYDFSAFQLPKSNKARGAFEKFIIFLKDYDVTNVETNDQEAMRFQFILDTLLNDDKAVGGADFAKVMQDAFVSSLSEANKFKPPVSKFGLSGILNSWFGVDISGVYTGVTLFGTNLERISGNTATLHALQDFISAYYSAASQAQVKKTEFLDFIKEVRNKHTTRKTNYKAFHSTSGIISKLIQVPMDVTAKQRNEALAHNIEQFEIGVNNIIDQGGNMGPKGRATKQLFDEIMLGAPTEHAQFVEYVAKKYPNNFKWVEDVSNWVATNLTEDAKFISEWLYGVPFSQYMYYLPTEMINLVDPEVDVESPDGSMMIDGNDKKFQHRNPVHVSRSGNLKERTGFIPLYESGDKKGQPDSKYAYGTNLENIAIKGVNNIINDIYTGFDRKILGVVNPSAGNAYQKLSEKMGGTKEIVNHLRKIIANMVNTDLNKHEYVTPLESAAASFRRNIAPPFLGSVHQALSQPASQMMAYIGRVPSAVATLPKAMHIMALTRKGLGVDINGFREVMNRTLGSRALPHDPALTKGESSSGLTTLDDLMLSHVVKEAENWDGFKNNMHVVHNAIKEGVLTPLRLGDMLSADMIFASELIRAGQVEQGITDPAKIDYLAISPEAIHRSVILMDEAINASMNSRRGTKLAHPSSALHLLTIFAGHRLAVATTFSTKLRTAFDLFADGNTKDPMFIDALKYMQSVVAQSIAFTAVKFMVLSIIGKFMYQLLTPEEDDERHWLYGELERKEVEKIRKLSDEAVQRGFGEGVLQANILRDIFGNVIAVTAVGGIDNVIFTQLFDTFGEPWYKESQQEAIDQINKQVAARIDSITPEQLQDFKNQIEAIEKTKYAPMGFKSFATDDFGGAFGAAVGLVAESTGALSDIPNHTKDFTWEEFVLFMRTLGVGQPELTRALKFGAKAKDEMAKDRAKEESELPEFDF